MYRTAAGKTVDMNALRNKNEHVRAVGNMNVNARGDTIDSNNQVTNDNNRRVNSMYNRTVAQGQMRNGAPATHTNEARHTTPVTTPAAGPLTVKESHEFNDFDSEPIIKK
jgi:hypothetical protein